MASMTLKSHIGCFLRKHIFSLRIFALNLFNQVFWILVIAGVMIGAKRGPVSGLMGLVFGTGAGVLFLAFGYALYVHAHPQNRDGAEPVAPPNGGPATPSGNSGVSGGPPSVS
jgi:hypothetical protein